MLIQIKTGRKNIEEMQREHNGVRKVEKPKGTMKEIMETRRYLQHEEDEKKRGSLNI